MKGNKAPSSNLLASLSDEQLKVLASDIRADILSAINANGGHLSSNLGAVELTMALLRAFDPLKDDLLFDVGHQTYTYKLLTGRSLDKLRQFGGEGPFSDRFSSPYDKYCNGHSSTSISVGIGMDIAKSLSGDKSYTVAIIGDSSVSSGLSMEALNLLSARKNSHLIVVINDNGMSIGKDIGFMTKRFQKLRNSRFYFRTSNFIGKKMSKHKWSWKLFLGMRNLKDHFKRLVLKDTVFEAMGLKYIGPFDGHDFVNLDFAFKKAKSMSENGPVVVHLITKKGFGYPKAAEDESGNFHGVAPYFAEPGSSKKKGLDYSDLKLEELDHLMNIDKRVYVITPAMEKGSNLERLFKRFPDRTIDVGIAEENAVTLASGLALKGNKPVIDIYSTFLQRSYDEIIEDISREKIPALFIIERAGIVGQDGSSHHGIYDVAMLSSIPYCKVYMPFDKESNADLFKKIVFTKEKPIFIRYSKEEIQSESGASYFVNYALFEKNPSHKSCFLGVGPRGLKVIRSLKEKRINIDKMMLINLLPDNEQLDSLKLDQYERIYLYDPYGIYEGTGARLNDYLAERHFASLLIPFTLKRDFYTFGDAETVLKSVGLDTETVTEKIISAEQKRS